MKAEHHHQRQQTADQDSRGPAGILGQEIKDQRQILAHHAADGPQNRQGQGTHHQEGEHGNKDQVDGFGNDPVQSLFHIGLDKYHQNNGDNSAGIADQMEWDQLKNRTGSPAETMAPQLGCIIIPATAAARIGLHLSFWASVKANNMGRK